MNERYCRLTEGYALRGWGQIPCVLVRRPRNQFKYLSQEQFRLLSLCDGRTELPPGTLSEKEETLLNSFVTDGWVSSSDIPRPISPDQEYRRYANRFLPTVQWSVTGRCNYRCRHCFMDAPNTCAGDLSHEEAMKVIGQLADCGVLRVFLTGGEPFVRPDFWELVDALLARGIDIGAVYTNGWLVDEALLGKFEARGLRPEFSVSFDGVGWHDWMRGVAGAEEAALRALRLCVARGFPVDVEMCVHKGNAHLLRETVNLLAGIGVYAIKCNMVVDSELWRKHSEGQDYFFQEFCEDVIEYIPHFFEDGCPASLAMGSVIALEKGSSQFQLPAIRYQEDKALQCHLCGSVRQTGYISPDGRLLPCMPMASEAPEVLEQFPKITEVGLQKCFSDSFYMEFIDRRVKDIIASNQKCAACPHVLACGGGCRANALRDTGNLMGSEEEQCILWNEGYIDRIRRTAEEAAARCRPEGVRHEAPAK